MLIFPHSKKLIVSRFAGVFVGVLGVLGVLAGVLVSDFAGVLTGVLAGDSCVTGNHPQI